MKLSQATNLRVEDYPDQATWIGRLFNVLNPFITTSQQIFDNNVDFATNIRSVTKDFDTSQISFPINFDWGFSQADPVQVLVTKGVMGVSPVVLLPAWSFDASTRQVSISNIVMVSSTGVSALTTGTRYKFTVRATV